MYAPVAQNAQGEPESPRGLVVSRRSGTLVVVFVLVLVGFASLRGDGSVTNGSFTSVPFVSTAGDDHVPLDLVDAKPLNWLKGTKFLVVATENRIPDGTTSSFSSHPVAAGVLDVLDFCRRNDYGHLFFEMTCPAEWAWWCKVYATRRTMRFARDKEEIEWVVYVDSDASVNTKYDLNLDDLISAARKEFETENKEESFDESVHSILALDHSWYLALIKYRLDGIYAQGLNTGIFLFRNSPTGRALVENWREARRRVSPLELLQSCVGARVEIPNFLDVPFVRAHLKGLKEKNLEEREEELSLFAKGLVVRSIGPPWSRHVTPTKCAPPVTESRSFADGIRDELSLRTPEASIEIRDDGAAVITFDLSPTQAGFEDYVELDGAYRALNESAFSKGVARVLELSDRASIKTHIAYTRDKRLAYASREWPFEQDRLSWLFTMYESDASFSSVSRPGILRGKTRANPFFVPSSVLLSTDGYWKPGPLVFDHWTASSQVKKEHRDAVVERLGRRHCSSIDDGAGVEAADACDEMLWKVLFKDLHRNDLELTAYELEDAKPNLDAARRAFLFHRR